MAKVYEKVAEIIEDRIIGGELEPLALIPSYLELAEQFGVRQEAIWLAITSLEERNYLKTLPNIGTYVRPEMYWDEVNTED